MHLIAREKEDQNRTNIRDSAIQPIMNVYNACLDTHLLPERVCNLLTQLADLIHLLISENQKKKDEHQSINHPATEEAEEEEEKE